MANETGSTWGHQELSRRQVLRYSGVAAAGVAGAGSLAACGGGSTAAAASGPQKSGGILIHGATGGSSKDTLDAAQPGHRPPTSRACFNLYEPLLYLGQQLRARSRRSPSPWRPPRTRMTWTVKLRQGVTFHNGKPVTAEDVLFTLQRVAEPEGADVGGRSLCADHRLRQHQEVDATHAPLIKLKTPYALLDYLLAEYTLGIVPADYDPKNPVGTGRVQVQVVRRPARTASFAKYDDYWGDKAFVDELHIQDFADPSAQVNALQAGQVQTIDNLPYNLIDTLKGQGGQILESKSGAWVPFTMRVDLAPFSDVRVRQAMRLIVDRQQMIDQRAERLRPARQRPLRPVRRGLRQRPAAARAGHRPGQVAAQAGRPGGPAGPAVHR